MLLVEIEKYEKELIETINKLLSSALQTRREHMASKEFNDHLQGLKTYNLNQDEDLPADLDNEYIKTHWPVISEGIILKAIGEHAQAKELLAGFSDELIGKCRKFIFSTLEIERRDNFLRDTFDDDPLYATITYQSNIVEIWLQVCILQKLNEYLQEN